MAVVQNAGHAERDARDVLRIVPLGVESPEVGFSRVIFDERKGNYHGISGDFGLPKGADSFFKNSDDGEVQLADADIVVSGAGQANLFSAQHLKSGATVIDFGFNKIDGKITGDFDTRGAEDKNIHYTKTPGGTGPILVAKLFENFYKLGGR